MISKHFLFALIPTLLIFGTGFFPAMLIIYRFKRQTRKKKSPLNMDLLRSPGETLREKMDELSDTLMEKLMLLIFGPVFAFSVWTGQLAYSGNPLSLFAFLFFFVILVCFCVWQGKSMYDLFVQRSRLRLGYECEVAVGQGLAPLAKEGFDIFHDFPSDQGFNIDHIAVGPQGVFAVETKGRAKHIKAENENWKVRFDGEKLIFPNGSEKQPVEQAKRQAKWLESWIGDATAERVRVIPVLAVPGWFVDQSERSADILIAYGKNYSFLTKGRSVLSENQIKRISFQIDRECRTVQAKAYKK